MHIELKAARHLLEAWSAWFHAKSGYSHRSSIERFNDGWGISSGTTFRSEIPPGVEPNLKVRRVSKAIHQLQLENGGLAEVLYAKYRKTRSVNDKESSKIRMAEMKFFAIFINL